MNGLGEEQRAFLRAVDVSRETLERLAAYEHLLKKWNPSINLVAKSTLPTIWRRHFLDSAQLFALARHHEGHWADLGAGGGFPGLVIAIMAMERAPGLRVTCVESDQRKAAFLRTVVRELGLPARVLAERAEEAAPLQADVLSARALAPLARLLPLAERHLKPGGQALFPKGESFRDELSEALETWSFQSEEYPSITDGSAVILSLGDIRRV